MSFPSEIQARLVAQGIAAAKIYIGTAYQVPPTGDYLGLFETGGMSPWRVHNTGAVPSYVRPSMQLVARSVDYEAAMLLARAAYDAVIVRDMYLSGIWYLSVEPIQEPFDLGLDDNGRVKIAFNIAVLKRPS